MKKLVMEFLGTFFLILTIVITANPLAIAAMLMAWVYIGGYVSGGHYNPLVSFAVALRGKMLKRDLPYYMGAQVLGGFVAYLFAAFLHGHITLPQPGSHVGLLQAFVVEILLAFVFALVVLVTATSDRFRTSHVFGFAIGFTIPALAFLGGPISGGLFNPAIAIGAALFGILQGFGIVWEYLIMYVGGSFAGAALAAYVYTYFFPFER